MADFVFQSNETITLKQTETITFKSFWKSELFKHAIIYLTLSSLFCLFYQSTDWLDYLYVFLILLSHLVIDAIKLLINKSTKNKWKWPIFILDQAAHAGMILWAGYLLLNRFQPVQFQTDLDSLTWIRYGISVLILTVIANSLFKILFSRFKTLDAAGSPNAGAIIGSMERLLVLILLITNNLAVIGLVIAAKSLARLEKLKDEKFTEYFMIGTFYSLIFTILVYYLFFKLLLPA